MRRALLLTLLLALSAAAPAHAALHLSQIGSFSSPVYVTAPPGDPHRVFVVEQGGRIMEVKDGTPMATPFLDIQSLVESGGEEGLLSMAFAPDYATSGKFYVDYTAPASDGDTLTIEEFGHAAGNLDAADPASGRVVLTIPHPTNLNHNGGQLQFGPDGLLYASTGDGGGSNDPPDNAQTCPGPVGNPDLLGKLLRIDPHPTGGAQYGVPPGNGCGGTTPIYDYGLRNPWRFSFDRATGDLVIGDVGQGAREEVDWAPLGSPAGINYGWHCREGDIATPGVTCTAPEPVNPVDPVLVKSHSGDGFCAIVGGYVVRDPALAGLTGRYVYGDECGSSDHIRSAVLRQPNVTDDADTGLPVPQLSSFGEDSCGHVYATSLAGPVFRIDGDAFTPCPDANAGGGGGGGGATADTRPPRLLLGARRLQRVVRQKGFRVAVSCDEMCGVTAGGRMRVGHSKRIYVLKPVTRQLGAGGRAKLRLKLSHRGLRAVRSALRHHRRASARLIATARDAAANQSSAQKLVRAKR